MLRFHHVEGAVKDTLYLVSARRRPRGYVVRGMFAEETTRITLHSAHWDEQYVEGWVPVGLNGARGARFATRRAAALALVSDHRFDTAPSQPGT